MLYCLELVIWDWQIRSGHFFMFSAKQEILWQIPQLWFSGNGYKENGIYYRCGGGHIPPLGFGEAHAGRRPRWYFGSSKEPVHQLLSMLCPTPGRQRQPCHCPASLKEGPAPILSMQVWARHALSILCPPWIWRRIIPSFLSTAEWKGYAVGLSHRDVMKTSCTI